MVRPAERRRIAEWACGAFRVTERRACLAVGVARSTFRYRSRKPPQGPLRLRIRELAGVHTYAGYRRLHVYLRREGWQINHKRVYRLYQEDGLALRRKRARRRRSAVSRASRPQPTESNQYWSMDFMHDALADGRSSDLHFDRRLQSRVSCVETSYGFQWSGCGGSSCGRGQATSAPKADLGRQWDGVHVEGS